MEDRRRRIGIFIDTYFPVVDGVVMVVHNYAMRLSQWADVTVFCPSDQWRYPDDSKYPYNVVRCRALKVPIWEYNIPLGKMDRRFARQLKASNLDLVDIHSPYTVGIAGLQYARAHGIPVVSHMHSQYHRDLLRITHSKTLSNMVMKRLMKVLDGGDEAWALNKDMADIFMQYGSKSYPQIWPNGTDMLPLAKTEAQIKDSLKQDFDIDPDRPLLLFVGRLNKLKNILFLVDAMAELKKSGQPFQLCYVGDGPDKEALISRIRAHQLEDDVRLLGRVTEREKLANLYAGAKLFCFPSYYDASSLVQIEAASQHTPTVFLENAATACTVENEVSGFIVPNDPVAYAKALAQIINDDTRYKRVAQGAFDNLYHNWDDLVQSVYGHFCEMIDQNASKKDCMTKQGTRTHIFTKSS